MDPGGTRSSGGRFEVFDSNARFVVIRDDEGYGIWRPDDLEEGEPIERFSDDDEGYERAAERWKVLTRTHRGDWSRCLPRIKWVVLVSAITWALSGVVLGALLFEVFEPRSAGSVRSPLRGVRSRTPPPSPSRSVASLST